MSQTVSIRHAIASDAMDLSRLAEQLFRTAFGPQNNAAQMDLYCTEHFGPELQAAEISNPSAMTLLLEDPSGLQGFAQLLRGGRPSAEVDVGQSPVEVQRFYVAPALHGRGVAQLLMQRVQEEARRGGGDMLWLGVWKENPRAIAFYHKTGFTTLGEQIFMLGTEPQYDYIMAVSLEKEV